MIQLTAVKTLKSIDYKEFKLSRKNLRTNYLE